jgi:hypothetical protein
LNFCQPLSHICFLPTFLIYVFSQLFLYLVFFAIVLTYYGMPLHIVRELYNTFASFQKRISDFVRYRCRFPAGPMSFPCTPLPWLSLPSHSLSRPPMPFRATPLSFSRTLLLPTSLFPPSPPCPQSIPQSSLQLVPIHASPSPPPFPHLQPRPQLAASQQRSMHAHGLRRGQP